VEQWVKQTNRWQLAEYGEVNETIELASIGVILPLTEVYDKIDFDSPALTD